MRHNGGQHAARRPEEILAEIERTRHEMDSTLTAIEHRLTPGQLVDHGLDYLRHSGANEFVQNMGSQVKNNPLPVALVGIGLAWLMASSKNPPPQYSSPSYGPSLGERAGEFGDKAAGMAEAAKSRLSTGSQAVGERIRHARDSFSSATQSARQRVSDLGESARHQMDRARSNADYMVHEQPLALGAIGLAVGAVLAAMAPRTRKEDELMGETRDRLLDQAKEVGKEKLEQAKEVANTAVGAASREAENRGLKPSSQKSSTTTPMASTSIGPTSGPGNLP
jgi:ElaB/YqjD/DUF883 family membrane-anchored ribosome-binding protein